MRRAPFQGPHPQARRRVVDHRFRAVEGSSGLVELAPGEGRVLLRLGAFDRPARRARPATVIEHRFRAVGGTLHAIRFSRPVGLAPERGRCAGGPDDADPAHAWLRRTVRDLLPSGQPAGPDSRFSNQWSPYTWST
ncbi:hypothetical protein GCM10010276_66590 [Streptomyces longisporus]|uniref:Uncharacterized protein n=1 Tax=Streptomyces longisporus TaxID=1948 RepID=A0ABP6A4S4_STRLO